MKFQHSKSEILIIGFTILGISTHCGQDTAFREENQIDIDMSGKAIFEGTPVNDSTARMIGAVSLGNCSGTLVTPIWVLTANHCAATQGAAITLGNASDSSAPVARVKQAYPDPGDNYASGVCSRVHDAALVRLATPLYPTRADGSTWEGYRRNLYRSSLTALIDSHVDIYGYGNSDDGDTTGLGTLRFANNIIEDYDSSLLQYDKGIGETRGGDSGAGILYAGYGSPGWHEDYQIVAVHNGRCDGLFWETSSFGAPADILTTFFDSTVGADWVSYDYPSLIMTAANSTL